MLLQRRCAPQARRAQGTPRKMLGRSISRLVRSGLLGPRSAAAPVAARRWTTSSAVDTRLESAQTAATDEALEGKSTAYPFAPIEAKWQEYWETNQTFRTPEEIDTSKPKYYVLDMVPYPRCASACIALPRARRM